MQQAVANPRIISLAAGLVDQEILPVAEALATVQDLLGDADRGRRSLQYGTTHGDLRLRERIVEHLEHLEGISARKMAVDVDHVVITTGSQQLLQLIGDVLIDPDDVVLVGAPDYFVFLGTLQTLGAQVETVAMDAEGLVPEALDATLAGLARTGDLPRVKLVYCDSYCQNPSGVTLAPRRRPEILEILYHWSSAGRIFLLEDAAYRELCYEGQSPRSIRSYDEQGETVILAQTFSKSFAPGLKTGGAILPPSLVEPLLGQKGNHDFGSANFNQHLLAELLASDRYRDHAARLRNVYRHKRDTMLTALEYAFSQLPVKPHWVRPAGGLYVWVTFPERVDTTRGGPLFAACQQREVLYVPGEFCYPAGVAVDPTSPLGGSSNTMRLTFGGLSRAQIREGVARLAGAIRDIL